MNINLRWRATAKCAQRVLIMRELFSESDTLWQADRPESSLTCRFVAPHLRIMHIPTYLPIRSGALLLNGMPMTEKWATGGGGGGGREGAYYAATIIKHRASLY